MEKKLISLNSEISGRGVFVKENIKKGKVICNMKGKKYSINSLAKIYKNIPDCSPLQIDDYEYLILDKPYIFFNHSCNPNSFVKGKNTLVALRSIKKGEEVTFDYSTTTWDDRKKWRKAGYYKFYTLKCKCGNKNCRKVIGQFYDLPNSLIFKYKKKKMLPDFILKKLK
jgi:hypothetical protein